MMRLFLVVIATAAAAGVNTADASAPPEEGVVAVLNGTPIQARELDHFMVTKGVPADSDAKLREALLNQLIDTRLIAADLAEKKIKADPITLERTFRAFLNGIRKSKNDPEKVLRKLGHTLETFKAELALTLAWQKYADGVITATEVRAIFDNERNHYDGTRLRARQIVLKIPQNAGPAQTRKLVKRLDAIRDEIVAGKMTFADAAKKYSSSPSRNQGGDVGYFIYRGGRLPFELSRVAFSLTGKEISKPVVTRYGAHILQVTDRKPGQLSLEDVRPEILKRLTEELWKKRARQLRAAAKIERK